jgi:hypothetical protein
MCHWDCSVRELFNFPLCSHVQLPGTLSIGPCAGSQDSPAPDRVRLLQPESHQLRNYPEFCPMASWWLKMELRSDGPLLGNPGQVHAQYPGDTLPRPFPDSPPPDTLRYPVHDGISFPKCGAESRVR